MEGRKICIGQTCWPKGSLDLWLDGASLEYHIGPWLRTTTHCAIGLHLATIKRWLDASKQCMLLFGGYCENHNILWGVLQNMLW